jgi:diacylglycerol kinase family enzyme
MRITLLYNPDAGEGMSSALLREEIERHGHEILHVVNKDADLEQALEGSPQAVVAAGGDGTVSRAANLVTGRPIALAILPLGTANNIATSLGIDGPLPQLIDAWSRSRPLALDLGLLRTSQGERRFIEGAGLGLVTAGIAAMTGDAGSENGRRESRLVRAARGYLDVLSRLKARRRAVTLDGRREEGAFLLVEALNIRSVGPNLVLSPDASPSDGFFSVVLADEDQRETLADYLRARIAGENSPLRLTTRLAREMEIEDVEEMHVDDEVRSWASRETVSLRIEAGALRVLLSS